MKLNRSLKELPIQVSRDTLISAIVVQLQALGGIPKSVNLLDIVDIKFGDTTKNPIELKVVLKEEVDTITF